MDLTHAPTGYRVTCFEHIHQWGFDALYTHTYIHHKHSTIGYGDISAKTTEERSLAIIVMILGAPERGGGRGGEVLTCTRLIGSNGCEL